MYSAAIGFHCIPQLCRSTGIRHQKLDGRQQDRTLLQLQHSMGLNFNHFMWRSLESTLYTADVTWGSIWTLNKGTHPRLTVYWTSGLSSFNQHTKANRGIQYWQYMLGISFFLSFAFLSSFILSIFLSSFCISFAIISCLYFFLSSTFQSYGFPKRFVPENYLPVCFPSIFTVFTI